MSDAGDETPTQRAARLRREKRQAKIASGGTDRLNKITNLGGRPASSEMPFSPTSTASTSSTTSTPLRSPIAATQPQTFTPLAPSVADDPDEVDISAYSTSGAASNSALQQEMLMRQMLRGDAPGAQDPFAAQTQDMSNDPMMQMMQQLLGGQAGSSNDPNASGGLPPALAAMMNGGAGMPGATEAPPATSADYLWRVVHALFAFLLSLYTVSIFTFTGTRFSREYSMANQEGVAASSAPKLFAMFATMELVLQGARYLVDGGKLPQAGMLGMIGGMLPEPWAGYIRMWSRYSIIWTSVVSDVMVVVFVLGAAAWWNGEVAV